MKFGKFNGKTIEWILKKEPSYVLWMHEKSVAIISEDIVIEAEEEDDAKRDIRRSYKFTDIEDL